MTWMQAVGGPAHGKWIDVPRGRSAWKIYEAPVTTAWSLEPPTLLADSPRCVLYEVRKALVPGWRFPLKFLAAPGATLVLADRQPEAWPNLANPDVRPPFTAGECRCQPDLHGRMTSGPLWSMCHLDHCPIHGGLGPLPEKWFAEAFGARAYWLGRQRVRRESHHGRIDR